MPTRPSSRWACSARPPAAPRRACSTRWPSTPAPSTSGWRWRSGASRARSGSTRPPSARTDGQQWHAQAVFDPSERLVPTRPLALDETFCAFTVQSDGPFAVPDARASPVPLSAPGAYLGAPVFVGGRCAGTLSAVGHAPRPRPFGDDDRALVEALARWVGSAVGGRETAQRLAAREADLTAFFDAAPMGMGIACLVDTDGGPDLQIVAVNAAAAALLGSEPTALRGRTASDVGEIALGWRDACLRVLDAGRPVRVESVVDGPDGRRTLATTVAPIDGHDGARFTFVVEDAAESQRTADRAHEREAQVEALVAQAPWPCSPPTAPGACR